MVALIHKSMSIKSKLDYHENKVKAGVAECIGEGNYPVDLDKLSYALKLNRFTKRLELADPKFKSCLHFSLNFHPIEAGLSKQKLLLIAHQFMQKVGLGEQPYLVYQHHDTAHPHLHVLTVNVKNDGRRIHIHWSKLYEATQEIELNHGLIRIGKRKETQGISNEETPLHRLKYGEFQTSKSIANILAGVLEKYAYTNLEELNAVLRQYHVLAYPGGIHSRIFKYGGMTYTITDEQGKPVGQYIKASAFEQKPTLAYLEKQFKKNESRRMLHKVRVQNAVLGLKGNHLSLPELVERLAKQGIHMTSDPKGKEKSPPLLYVDHQTKCVFHEKDLGPSYSRKVLSKQHLHEPGPLLHPPLNWQAPEHGETKDWSGTLKRVLTDLPYAHLNPHKQTKELEEKGKMAELTRKPWRYKQGKINKH